MKIIFREQRTVTEEHEAAECPFCGGRPLFRYAPGDHGYSEDKGTITCEYCGATVEVGGLLAERDALLGALKKWNRRHA